MTDLRNLELADESDELTTIFEQDESRIVSALPPSVQLGIPKLGKTPANWRRFRLGDVLRIVERPANVVDNKVYQLVTAKRSRGGIVGREALRGDQIKTKTQFFVLEGDFLISKRQISHGACGLIPEELDGAIVSNEYTVLHTSEHLDPDYLRLLSHTIYFQQACFQSSIGVHVEKLLFRIDDWFKWEIDLPPIAEQRRIVALLSKWDRAIDTYENLTRAKGDRFEAALAQLIGKAQSEREPPSGWHRSELTDLARIRSGGTPAKTDGRLWGGTLPWISAKDLKTFYLTDASEKLSELGATKASIAASGTVLILVRGMGLFKDIPIGVTTRDFAFNQDIKALVTGAEINARFLAYALKSRRRALMSRVDSAGHGTGRLSTDFLESLPITYPSPELQDKIVDSLDLVQHDFTLSSRVHARMVLQRKELILQLLDGASRRIARLPTALATEEPSIRLQIAR